MAASKITIGLVDHSAEYTASRMYVEELADDNFDDLFDPVTGAVSLLQGALILLTGCEHVATSLTYVSDRGTGEPPSEVTAQREIAIKVTYRDTVTGKVEHLTVPGPVAAVYPPTGTDVIPLSNVAAAAFITVFEANAVSQDGNAIVVTGIRLIGRNT